MANPAEIPPPEAAVPEPLARRLERLLADEQGGQVPAITLNLLLERTQGRGIFLIVILLCLPFVTPVVIPGSSIPFGLAIAWLALKSLGRGVPRLPRFLGGRPLPGRLRQLILDGGIWILKRIEKRVPSRRCAWLELRPVRVFSVLLLTFWALFLALPFPPLFPPMANNLPAYAILLLAVSLLEQDGRLMRIAYAFSAFNVVYFVFWGELIRVLFVKWGHAIGRFLDL